MGAGRSLDEVLADLADVARRIDGASPDDPGVLAALRAEQEALRAEAGSVRERIAPGESVRALRAEPARLEGEWERLQADHVDVVRHAGGGSSGGDFGFAADAMAINRAMDRARGRDRIEARIRELKARLGGEGG